VLTLRLNAIMSTDILFNVKKTKLIGLNFWWLLKILSYNCVDINMVQQPHNEIGLFMCSHLY
jgi:hypothetical protein